MTNLHLPISNCRSGVTLLEVMISMFVIMVGLLGVAAMLPLGARLMTDIERTDRARACSQAWAAQVPARRLLNLTEPTAPGGPLSELGRYLLKQYPQDGNGDVADNAAVFPHYAPETEPVVPYTAVPYFVIDPLGYWEMPRTGTGAANVFPYAGVSPDDITLAPSFRHPDSAVTVRIPIQLSRVTLRASQIQWAGSAPPRTVVALHTPMPLTVAERIFLWEDDTEVSLPADLDIRPRQMLLANHRDSGGALQDRRGYALPRLASEQPPASDRFDPLYRQSRGDYSYMVLRRGATEYDVIVYYQRDFDSVGAQRPLERTVCVNWIGGGSQGGDVKLTVDVPDPPDQRGDASFLDIKRNQHILVCGISNSGILQYKWYRVTMIDNDIQVEGAHNGNTRYSRYATLEGDEWKVPNPNSTPPPPPWQEHWCAKIPSAGPSFTCAPADLDGDGNAMDAIGVVVDNVIHVECVR